MQEKVEDKKTPLPDVSAIVLTFDEERNIAACLSALSGKVKDIFIVDSYSADNTLQIARGFTSHVYQNKFESQAQQLQWAFENLPIRTKWIMRVDADERWTPEALRELAGVLGNDSADSIYVKMRIYFMGRWMRHGGHYPNHYLRVFKSEHAKVENRLMDEHIIPYGRTFVLKNDIIEYNMKDRNFSLSNFIAKHNSFATREAVEAVAIRNGYGKIDSVADVRGGRTERKRYIKEKVYYRLPPFLRAFLYFLYRYFFQLGFWDGKEGLVFHFLQGFWYRFLIDAKIMEIEKKLIAENKDIGQVVSELHGIKL